MTIPKSKISNSVLEKETGVLYKSYPVAANMVGTANRKENSVAWVLSNLLNTPPIMVDAARDVPGIMDKD